MHDDLEQLARMRAKKRVDSWGEQRKSPWQWLSVVIGFYSFLAMLVTWTGWANGELDLFVPVFTVFVGG